MRIENIGRKLFYSRNYAILPILMILYKYKSQSSMRRAFMNCLVVLILNYIFILESEQTKIQKKNYFILFDCLFLNI